MEANQHSKPAEVAAPPLGGYELRQKTHREIAIESTDNPDLGLEASGVWRHNHLEIKRLRAVNKWRQRKLGRELPAATIPILLKLKM
jgi:hypothetical protein